MNDKIETRQYADGSSATGPAPLPNHSVNGAPQASALPELPARLRAIEGSYWDYTLTYNVVRLEAADRIEALETTVAALTETLRQTGDRANQLERDLAAAEAERDRLQKGYAVVHGQLSAALQTARALSAPKPTT